MAEVPLRAALRANMHDGDEGGICTMSTKHMLDETVEVTREFLLDDDLADIIRAGKYDLALRLVVERLGGYDAGQGCVYIVDGTDTDGTVWHQCLTHDELALSPDAYCAKAGEAERFVRALIAPATEEIAVARRATRDRVDAAVAAIEAAGFTVQFEDYCESPRTPGLLGQIRGVTDRELRLVRVGLKANPTPDALAETVEHELRHVQEPEWDCGNRDVFGRGGK